MKSTILLSFFLVFCSVIVSTTASKPCHRFGEACPRPHNRLIAYRKQPNNYMFTMMFCEIFCRKNKAQYMIFGSNTCGCFESCKNPTRVRSRRVIVMFPLQADPDKVCH
ncbi:hypothetical protein TCAL_15500 [Tigriopus californicus]|uniref:DAN domain-containing protein n=1 Tax=Tigriopus californicus TaxID=6832 RepID=A0A553PTJ9_TIGCA|nr:hypothetical protein TCAL_15500 [Tigriopus californicus]